MKKLESAFVLVLLALTLICFSCKAINSGSKEIQQKLLDEQTLETDKAIEKSKSLQELNTVCTNVPLPQSFVFVYKGGIDDQKISLAYYYKSESSFDDVRVSIEEYFDKHGWNKVDYSHRFPKQIDFTNQNYRIAVYFGNTGGLSNFSIYCEKSSPD